VVIGVLILQLGSTASVKPQIRRSTPE